MNDAIKQPFSNAQLELLKAFSKELSEKDIKNLKKRLADFFAIRLMDEADSAWEKQAWNEEKVESLLDTKLRKK
jgi:hypothetical protein